MTAALDAEIVQIWDMQMSDTPQLIFGTSSGYMSSVTVSQDQWILETSVPSSSDYAISSDDSWVVWRGHKVLWLPPDYRPRDRCHAVHGMTLVLGDSSDRVTFIEFDPHIIPTSR